MLVYLIPQTENKNNNEVVCNKNETNYKYYTIDFEGL